MHEFGFELRINLIVAVMGLIALLSSSCSENFLSIDPSSFNKQIASRADIQSPEELIKVFAHIAFKEVNPQLHISLQKEANSEYTITLIRNNEQNPPTQGTKLVMRALRADYNHWQVLEIRKNWLCKSALGTTRWGLKPGE
jgi:hypothetical protein